MRRGFVAHECVDEATPKRAADTRPLDRADGDRQSLAWTRFPSLRAVRRHHVFNGDPSLLGRMSPRILQGTRDVCELLDRAREKP